MSSGGITDQTDVIVLIKSCKILCLCMHLCALYFYALSELLLNEHCESSIFRKISAVLGKIFLT